MVGAGNRLGLFFGCAWLLLYSRQKTVEDMSIWQRLLELVCLGLLLVRRHLWGNLCDRRSIICRSRAGRLTLIILGRTGIIGNTGAGLVSHKATVILAIGSRKTPAFGRGLSSSRI